MNILFSVSGSIAAYKSVDVLRDIQKQLKLDNSQIKVLLTGSAQQLVSEKAFEAFFGSQCLSNEVFSPTHLGTDHIAEARWADVIVVYGATANRMAQFAAGFADDFLNLQVLASSNRVLLAPAMNPVMWADPITQKNLETLKAAGFEIAEPIEALVACGEYGVGHVAKIEEIIRVLKQGTVTQTFWTQKRILITAGPMRSLIDPVRYLQNRSSGKMGLALAKYLNSQGARVTVALGPVESDVKAEFQKVANVFSYVNSTDYSKVLETQRGQWDWLISAAAVLDYEVEYSTQKASREKVAAESNLSFKIKTVDDFVARECKYKKSPQKVVAFAAEADGIEAMIKNAQKKLTKKNCNYLLLNEVSEQSGPDQNSNKMWALSQHQTRPEEFELMSKADLARTVCSWLVTQEQRV